MTNKFSFCGLLGQSFFRVCFFLLGMHSVFRRWCHHAARQYRLPPLGLCPVESTPLTYAVTALPCGCVMNEASFGGSKCPVCWSATTGTRVNHVVRQLVTAFARDRNSAYPRLPGPPAVFIKVRDTTSKIAFKACNREACIQSADVLTYVNGQMAIVFEFEQHHAAKVIRFMRARGLVVDGTAQTVAATGTHNLWAAFEILAHDNVLPSDERMRIQHLLTTAKLYPCH